MSQVRLRDPPDLLAGLLSDGVLNLRCNESMIPSLLGFFFASLDDDFPHHDGMVLIIKTWQYLLANNNLMNSFIEVINSNLS